jgi:hypothetical protein
MHRRRHGHSRSIPAAACNRAKDIRNGKEAQPQLRMPLRKIRSKPLIRKENQRHPPRRLPAGYQ